MTIQTCGNRRLRRLAALVLFVLVAGHHTSAGGASSSSTLASSPPPAPFRPGEAPPQPAQRSESERTAPGVPSAVRAAVENGDRAALVALYNATGGPDWANNDNWLTNAPLREWHGVSTNAAGRVDDLLLDWNGLSGPIPPQLGDLTNLEWLHLSNNELSGPIPPQLGDLTNLTWLTLSSNMLSGTIPPELGNLTNLKELTLGDNELSGPIPSELGNLTNLTWLRLGFNELSGTIPPQLGDLTNLTWLTLSSNMLSGTIPPELGNLTNLKELHLGFNELSGPIPSELGNLTNLTWLTLSSNMLSGTIPPELGNLTNLEELRLGFNELSGTIPPQLGDLTSLEVLELGFNELSGTIPPQLGNLTSLKWLRLGDNELSGTIPPQLGNLTNLKELHLGDNELSGSIPSELRRLSRLESLSVSGNAGLCAPEDREFLAWLLERGAYPDRCAGSGERLLPSVMMRQDSNGMSLLLPQDLGGLSGAAVEVSDRSVVAASVAGGRLVLSPRGLGSAEVRVARPGGAGAVAEVHVRAAVGTFGIDLFLEQPAPLGVEAPIVRAADWWSARLDGTEWPDRRPGCPDDDVFDGAVEATADELLIGVRVEDLRQGVFGYFNGCHLPPVAGGAPVLRPGGGWVVSSPGAVGSVGLYVHEIGHALGLVLWGPDSGLVTPDGKYFTGPRAVEAYRADGGDPALPGVPISDDRVHWADGVADFMTSGERSDLISLAALADGGYIVDLSKALLPLRVWISGWTDTFSGDSGELEFALNDLYHWEVLDGTECARMATCPTEPLKRWEMAVWLVRSIDQRAPAAVDATRFADVDADQWWAPYVERLAALEVTDGCRRQPLPYCPDRDVTRAEMATFLTRAFDLEPAAPAGFTDTADDTHSAGIDALAAANITDGCRRQPLSYCPNDKVKRAEMALFLYRALNHADLT